MTAITDALDVAFNDPNVSASAQWTSSDGTSTSSCRVIQTRPEDDVSVNQTDYLVDGIVVDVRVMECDPDQGDTLVITNDDGVTTSTLIVHARRALDHERYVRTVECEFA